MKRSVAVIPILIAVLLAGGCIHKTGGTVSPQERIMTDNAILAQFVNTAEQGTEAAVTSGLLSTTMARPVIQFEMQFGTVHQQITQLLNQGLTTQNLAQVQNLLSTLKTSGTNLVNSGQIGVKNPKTQMTISADISNIIALTQAVITDVQLFQNQNGGAQ